MSFICFAAAISIVVEFPSEFSCSDNNDDGKKRRKSIGLRTRVSIYQVYQVRYRDIYIYIYIYGIVNPLLSALLSVSKTLWFGFSCQC